SDRDRARKWRRARGGLERRRRRLRPVRRPPGRRGVARPRRELRPNAELASARRTRRSAAPSLQSRRRPADAVCMASEPSIKGSALSSVVEDLRALRDSGRISIARLEKTLQPADLALLDTQIQPALWYPIQSYARLTEVLLEVLGRGDPQYIADRGARAAQRLWESGLYVQLQHGEEKAARARRSGGVMSDRDARVITTLSAAIFNFT